jgi:hypothetical protein
MSCGLQLTAVVHLSKSTESDLSAAAAAAAGITADVQVIMLFLELHAV